VLITEGVDVALVKALRKAAEKEGASLELIAPSAGEIRASDDSWIQVQQRIDGGPSVLYDAVALLASNHGAQALTEN
jgi:catalase